MAIFSSLFVIMFIASSVDMARILAVFPVPAISHQSVFRPITQELAKRGHEVVVITPNPAFPKGETPPRLREIDVHDISYKIWLETYMKALKGNKGDTLSVIKIFLESISYVVDAILQTKEVKGLMKDERGKFDLLLLEECVKPALGFSYVFKAPVILISSLGATPGHYELMGASEHPTLYPSELRQRLYNLTMWEKIVELFNHYQFRELIRNSDSIGNQVLSKNFGREIPTIKELGNNVDLMLLNSYPVFHGSHPVPPSIVYLGGLHQNPSKPLPDDLKKYLDSSRNGVIYVSFGTSMVLTLLPTERVQTLVRAFSKLSYDVLFKWNDDELQGCPNNVKISKWLPQSDLLKHPKIKLFITQGGQQSTDEAITAGVPLIGIPMRYDQWYNVQKYVHHKIGEELDLKTLTEQKLINTIHAVITDDSYRLNVIRLRSLILDQPMKPLDRAVWWIEYVIRHNGAKHLRAPAVNISWSQYLELELVITLLLVFLLVLTIFLAGLFLLYKYILSNSIVYVWQSEVFK